MSRQHVEDGAIRVRQMRRTTRSSSPRSLAVARHHRGDVHLTFLVTEYGEPFAPAGFGNWFGDRCDEAGLL